MVTTGLAEGPGWRDFALVRHQRRHGPLVGTLILGVLWAAWHFPLFLTEWGAWMGGADPMAVLQFVAFRVVLSVVVTWVFNRTNGSLPLAIVAHVSNSTFVQVESTKDIPMTRVPRTVLCWTAPCPASRERFVYMADISVSETGPRSFEVDLDGTTHSVSIPEDLIKELNLPEDDLERVVRESFGFLLEREPASSIMQEFSLDVIPTYFPEYKKELPKRL